MVIFLLNLLRKYLIDYSGSCKLKKYETTGNPYWKIDKRCCKTE